jgi:hypothetical protein
LSVDVLGLELRALLLALVWVKEMGYQLVMESEMVWARLWDQMLGVVSEQALELLCMVGHIAPFLSPAHGHKPCHHALVV